MKENNKTKDNKKGLKVLCYSLLVAVSLTAIGLSMCNLLGYTSLVGEKGETGSKGDKGESGDPGQKGETGDKGATGETGIKGETGDQGEQGDKGATGDPGSKGEKGDKGDKGSTGSTGSDGKDADKYYNCTILKSTGGYITLDKGCAKVGETVTFTIVPESNYIFNKLLINEVPVKDNTSYVEGEVTYSCNMEENGLVVSADFLDVGTNPVLDVDSNSIYTSISAAIAASKTNLKLLNNITLEGGEYGTGATITLNTDLTLDLNEKTLTFDDVTKGFVVNGNYLFTVQDTSTNKDGKIVVNGYGENGDSAIQLVSGSDSTSSGKLTLESGEIVMKGNNSGTSQKCYAINAGEYAIVNIIGGKVSSSQSGTGYTQVILASNTTTLNIRNATITHNSTNTTSSTIGGNVKPTITKTTFNGYTSFAGTGGTITECTFNSKVGTSNNGSNEMKFNKCILNDNYENVSVGTGVNQNGKLVDCTIEGELIRCANKVISGTSSKFKNINGFNNDWLAEGYSLTTTIDDDGYYHLTYTGD